MFDTKYKKKYTIPEFNNMIGDSVIIIPLDQTHKDRMDCVLGIKAMKTMRHFKEFTKPQVKIGVILAVLREIEKPGVGKMLFAKGTKTLAQDYLDRIKIIIDG